MKTLTQAKRDQARERARSSIRRRHGAAPTREQFQHHSRKYPLKIQAVVYILMLIPLVAFLLLSAMRLFAIGKQMHADVSLGAKLLGVYDQAPIAGLAIVLGAEFAQVVFTVALTVLAGGRKAARFAFVVGIILSTLIALIGNAQYALWGKDISAFRVLETLAPPIVVLVLGEVLALLWLDSISAGHETQRLYDIARNDWAKVNKEPERHPEWLKAYATALRDELCRYNGMSIDDLQPDEWRTLVQNEIDAENWYSTEFHGMRMEPRKVSKNSKSGLIYSVDGDGTQVEKVIRLFNERPELLELPPVEAIATIGVGNSTFYKAKQLFTDGHGIEHST